MLTNAELHEFMTDRTLRAIDPVSGDWVATVTYGRDGRLNARFADGSHDTGDWGIDGARYWTRYQKFRNGSRNRFYLEWAGAQIAQAYFDDGRRAFLQSSEPKASA